MNGKRQTWTVYDATYALVVVPLLIVAAMTIAGIVSWRSQSNQVERAWDVVIADIGGDDSLALAKWYDENKSQEPILKFKRVLAASDAIFAQFDECSPDFDPTEIVTPTPPGQPLPFAFAVQELAEQAKPVLRLLSSIEETDANVWQPIIFEGADLPMPEALQSRSLMRLLKIEFLDAYHQGDHQRAIEALNLLHRFYSPDYRAMSASDDRVRRDAENIARKLIMHSMSHDVWTEADLDRIGELVSRDPQWQRRWKDLVRGEILLDPPWIERQTREYWYPMLGMLMPRSTIAPSEKLGIAKRYALIASTDEVATQKHVQRISGIDHPRDGGMNSAWAPDRWLQLPRMNADWSEYISDKPDAETASAFVNAANEQRLARCAVALKRFAKRNGRFPESLDELVSVDLPLDAIKNQNGAFFRYEESVKDPSMASLWSNVALPVDNHKRGQAAFWNTAVISK